MNADPWDLTEAQRRQIREAHAEARRTPMPDADKVTAELAAIRDRFAVEAVLALHSEFRIYDECGHEHSQEEVDAGTAVNCDGADFVTCRDGYAYSVCRACCTDGWSQTEECASHHDHDCWPCPTYRAITTMCIDGKDGE